MTTTNEIYLGRRCEDAITGFNGIAIGHIRYLTGCEQLLLVPKIAEKNKKAEGEWFDLERISILDEPAVTLPGVPDGQGGDSLPPNRRADLPRS